MAKRYKMIFKNYFRTSRVFSKYNKRILIFKNISDIVLYMHCCDHLI